MVTAYSIIWMAVLVYLIRLGGMYLIRLGGMRRKLEARLARVEDQIREVEQGQ
jgi:uncharacterized membrane protein